VQQLHITHHEVSLMVSRNTTLVLSLGLPIYHENDIMVAAIVFL